MLQRLLPSHNDSFIESIEQPMSIICSSIDYLWLCLQVVYSHIISRRIFFSQWWLFIEWEDLICRSNNGLIVQTVGFLAGSFWPLTQLAQSILVFNLLHGTYSSESISWNHIRATGDIPSGTDGHSACEIGNAMYLFGGFVDPVSMLCYCYHHFHTGTKYHYSVNRTDCLHNRSHAEQIHTFICLWHHSFH